jgi:hypothetical protein
LREHESEFKAKGIGLAAIGLGDMHYAQLFREETGITFPLLVDDESKAYLAVNLKKANIFHLLRGDNTAARKRAKAAGHRQHMERFGRDPFQLGASFVFAPGNIDLFAHISETFGDNAKVEALLASVSG